MSHNNDTAQMDEHELELAALAHFPDLPLEIQHHIVSFLDMEDLAVLSILNKEWHAVATPLLWQHIDFPEVFQGEILIEAVRRFFVTCDTMLDRSPERFTTLASYVSSLDVGRVHGINIVGKAWDGDEWAYFDTFQASTRCIFDVIAQFPNLESFSIYVKNWWPYNSVEKSAISLENGLTKLESLKLGGQMPEDVLSALLHRPEQLKSLTLVNLISSPGQDHGPDGIAFLSDKGGRFTSLETLHLVKLADLDPHLSDNEGDHDGSEDGSDDESDDDERTFASRMRWRFPREAEVSVLEDWAALLRHASHTLRDVTLENRYLCGSGFDNGNQGVEFVIDPGQTHPADYGRFSIRESQRVLFRELLEQEWPALEKLTLVGMGKVETINQTVSHLVPRVQVEQRLAGIEYIAGDVTPEQVSTPVEFWDGYL